MKNSFECINWPNIIEKAVAYCPNFVSMAYGYDSDVHEDYFKPCCDKGKGVSVHYKDFEFPKSKVILKPYFQLDWYYYAVSPELKEQIIEYGIDDNTEDVFRPVWTRKHDKPICFSIEPKNTIEPIAQINHYKTKTICENCHITWATLNDSDYTVNNGIGKPLYITKEILNGLHDFNVTSEYFGPGGYLLRQVIVSKRIHDFILNKYPRAEFRPVLLIENDNSD